MTNPSKQKLKGFRRKVKDILDEELSLRKELKSLYDQFILDVGDDKLAKRQVQQVYFSIQKYRLAKLLEDRLEFHPFFTAHPFKVDELEDGEDGII